MVGGGTKLLGVMGHPVRHSLSPRMHNASFLAEGLDFVYVALEVGPEDLPAAVRGAVALGFGGFNLTMPHKEKVVSLLDELDGAASVSGAVNTVVVEGRRLRGYNTDGFGMAAACREAGGSVEGAKVVLLGAGGAGAAVAFAFGEQGVKELHVFNRDAGRAGELLGKLAKAGKEVPGYAYPLDALSEAAVEADILINATSVGMKEEDPLPAPAEYLKRLGPGALVCDAVYRPAGGTRFLQAAAAEGLRVVSGRRMLLHQGVLAQKLWTGREPNVEAMDAALRDGVEYGGRRAGT